jgi:hypothetical protein
MGGEWKASIRCHFTPGKGLPVPIEQEIILFVSLSPIASLSMALQSLWALAVFFSLLTYTQSVGLLRRGMSSSQGHYRHTEQHKQNKRTQTSMPRMGFEPKIPVL